MANSKQTLHISLQVNTMPSPGESIAKLHATYRAGKVVQVFDVSDVGLAEKLDYVLTPTGVAENVLYIFNDCDVDVTYDPSCHFLCDSAKCLVPGARDDECPNSKR